MVSDLIFNLIIIEEFIFFESFLEQLTQYKNQNKQPINVFSGQKITNVLPPMFQNRKDRVFSRYDSEFRNLIQDQEI